MRVVLASGNAKKLRELGAILADAGFELVPQGELGVDDADETGTTFVANALIKARAASAATGLPAIADDSGIAVAALDGRPGVYSARYAGEDGDDTANNAKLLTELAGVDDRRAAFHCVIAFVRSADDPDPVICEGRWDGEILDGPRGQNGFGYDPLFFVPSHGCSAAELEPEEKHRVSHRGQALAKLKATLAAAPMLSST